MKRKPIFQTRGQISMEYVLLLGGVLMTVSLFSYFLLNTVFTTNTQDIENKTAAVKDLRAQLNDQLAATGDSSGSGGGPISGGDFIPSVNPNVLSSPSPLPSPIPSIIPSAIPSLSPSPSPFPSPSPSPVPFPASLSDILVADGITNQVRQISPSQTVIRTVNVASPRHAAILSNGNLLVSQVSENQVVELDAAGKVVWQYGQGRLSCGAGPNQTCSPTYAQRLSNGNTLISDFLNSRVIEISGKSVVWQYGSTQGKGLNQTSNPSTAIRLPNGNTLIADTNNWRIIEVNTAGNVVWQFNNPNTVGSDFAQRLSNGNTLLDDSRQQRIIEVNPAGTIVWQYGGSFGSGPNQLSSMIRGLRLINGNTLIIDYQNNRIIEVDTNKNILRTYLDSNGPNSVVEVVPAMQPAGFVPAPSPCPDPSTVRCPRDFNPVCGQDGVTYPNGCNAQGACVGYFPGAC